MHRFFPVRIACLLLWMVGNAHGMSPAGAVESGLLSLAAPVSAELDALRLDNVRGARGEHARRKALKIGFGRALTDDLGQRHYGPESPGWVGVADGWLLRVAVRSPQAAGLRLELKISPDFPGELRFHGSADKLADDTGTYRAADWRGQATYWSPTTSGDAVTLEIFLPARSAWTRWSIELLSVSHLFVLPTERNSYGNLYPDTGTCEINIACTSSPDEVAAAKAVAQMSFVDGGDTYVCSGTLLGNTANATTPYFYTAHHCIPNQAVANTLNTYWHLQDSACTGRTDPYAAYKRLTRGATYLDSEEDNDHSFLQLNEAIPAGAVPLGWSIADLAANTRVVGIHHPNGDVKKISYGFVDTPADTATTIEGDSGELINHASVWRVRWQRGVTESGSSGSALLTCDGSSCVFRGGLIGGFSECSVSEGPDDYSKMGRAYARIKRWLAPNAPASASTTEIDCLLTWAENGYPQMFAPRGAASQTAGIYRYRYYAGTGAYLGVSSENDSLYYLGPLSGSALYNLGTTPTWLAGASCR